MRPAREEEEEEEEEAQEQEQEEGEEKEKDEEEEGASRSRSGRSGSCRCSRRPAPDVAAGSKQPASAMVEDRLGRCACHPDESTVLTTTAFVFVPSLHNSKIANLIEQ